MAEVQTLNQSLFIASMFIYLAATFLYVVYAAFRYQKFGETMGKLATYSVLAGVLIHTAAIA
jgi:hypothetical protein